MRTVITPLALAFLALAACGPAAPPVRLGPIPTHVVDTGVDVVGQAIAVDAEGAPHVAYVVDDVPGGTTGHPAARPVGPYYATWAGDHFRHELIERVDQGVMGGDQISIALDAGGRPHVAYPVVLDQSDHEAVHYAVRGPNGWSVVPVPDPTGSPAQLVDGPSLALDAAGRPHIAFATWHPEDDVGGTWQVWYGVLEHGHWQTTRLASWHWGVLGTRPHLVLDADGTPWVLYVVAENEAVALMHPTSHGWTRQILVSTAATMDDWIFDQSTALAVGPDGRIHATWDRAYSVSHAVTDGKTVKTDHVFDVPLGGHDAGGADLAVRSDGTPMIAYFDVSANYTQGRPELFVAGPAGWRHAYTDPHMRDGDTVGMALGPDDAPRLVYTGDDGPTLIYAGPLVGGGTRVAPQQ